MVSVGNMTVDVSAQMVYGNRVPRTAFTTTGAGDSSLTIHAGSYHMALQAAGIARCNIMQYSSMLPADLTITADHDSSGLVTGSVMDTIMAVEHGRYGDVLAACVAYAMLTCRVTGEVVGGVVAERVSTFPEAMCLRAATQRVRNDARASISELYNATFAGDCAIGHTEDVYASHRVSKVYGTVLAAICFTSYSYPILEKISNLLDAPWVACGRSDAEEFRYE